METYYGYDRAGRMTEETIRDDAGRAADTTYTWDKNGNRTQISFPSGVGAATTFGGGSSNGDRDKPAAVVRKDNSGDTTLVSGVLWMPSGPVAQYDQANTIGGTALRATLAWNKEYRSPDIVYATGATERFRLDIDENQQGKESYRNFTGAQTGVQDQRLKWDWQGRLRCDSLTTSACPTSGSNLRTNLTTFNGASGRLTWVHKGVATGTQSGSNVYGNGSQIDYITLDGNTLDFAWDARGNRTSDDLATASNDARSYTYDGNRRVRTITGQYYAGGSWVTYTITNAYDHQGRRYLRSLLAGGVESQTFYSYDESSRLVEVTHTPNVSAPTTYAVYQLYWLGERPLALYATSYVSGSPTVARYFTTADDANDVLELTSWPSSGDATVVWAVNQDAFGWDDVVVGSGLFQPLGKAGWIREGNSEAWHGTTTVGRPALQCRGGRYMDPMTGGDVQSDYLPGQSHVVTDVAGRHWDGDHCSTIDNGVPSGDVSWNGVNGDLDCSIGGEDEGSFACSGVGGSGGFDPSGDDGGGGGGGGGTSGGGPEGPDLIIDRWFEHVPCEGICNGIDEGGLPDPPIHCWAHAEILGICEEIHTDNAGNIDYKACDLARESLEQCEYLRAHGF